MRKDADFEVTDHIRVSVSGNDRISGIVAANETSIAGKVLADEIATDKTFAVSKEWNVNGENVIISIEQV